MNVQRPRPACGERVGVRGIFGVRGISRARFVTKPLTRRTSCIDLSPAVLGAMFPRDGR